MAFARSDVGDGAARRGVGRSRRRVTGINAKRFAGTGVSGMSREQVGPTGGCFSLVVWERRRDSLRLHVWFCGRHSGITCQLGRSACRQGIHQRLPLPRQSRKAAAPKPTQGRHSQGTEGCTEGVGLLMTRTRTWGVARAWWRPKRRSRADPS